MLYIMAFFAILYVSMAIETCESKYVHEIISRICKLILYGTFMMYNRYNIIFVQSISKLSKISMFFGEFRKLSVF